MQVAETGTELRTEVASPHIACDGGTLGHPRVFLTIPTSGHVACPYCGHEFWLAAAAQSAGQH